MRALLWGTLIVAGLWAGYWWVGSVAVKRAAESWFAAQTTAGVIAENDGVVVRGFPNRFDLTVAGPTLNDPVSGFGWSAPFLQVFTMTWKPWHLIAAFPPEQTIALPKQRIVIASTGMRSSLQLHPDADLGLFQLILEADAVGLNSSDGWAVTADRLVASLKEDDRTNNSFRIGFSLLGLVPDATVLAALALHADLLGNIEEIKLDAAVVFSAPLNRHAGENTPLLQGLKLREMRLIWGGLRVFVTGDLRVGNDGYAEGALALRIGGWRRVPAILAATGAVQPGVALSIERALETLAREGKDPEVLELPLTITAGRMRLGPIPLGAAPRLR